MKKENNWLVLAHLFNMDGNAASQTITDRLPFMAKAGVCPIIISSPTGLLDSTFEHYQVFSPAPSGIRWEMRYVIKRKFQSKTLRGIFKVLNTILCLPFYIFEKICIHLDCHWSWFLSASIKALQIIKKSKPLVIYSTAGPSSTHLAGYVISRLSEIPWVAELHDPLVTEDDKKNIQRYYFNRWLEKIIFKHASVVIYFTDNALKNAVQRNGNRDDTYVIRPGANPPDFSGAIYKKKNSFHLAHFGVLAKGRNLSRVLQAIYELVRAHPGLNKDIRLDLFGDDLDVVSQKSLSIYPIGEMIRYHGRLSRQQAMMKMRETDVLLLLHGENQISQEYIPSKVYEYMLAQRPILACTKKKSELGQFLINSGYYVAENDSDSIQKGILHYMEQWQRTGVPDMHPQIQYTVPNAVEQLIQAVNRLNAPET